MKKICVFSLPFVLVCFFLTSAATAPPADPLPKALRQVLDSAPTNYDFGRVTKHSNCQAKDDLPDQKCTPGNINTDLTADVICADDFRTGDYRNSETSEKEKKATYGSYNHSIPTNNVGKNQTTELDHLIPLTDGGADDLSNIWPQDAPRFREKDKIEVWIHRTVCKEFQSNKAAARRDLRKFQITMATDWRRLVPFVKPKPPTKPEEQISE